MISRNILLSVVTAVTLGLSGCGSSGTGYKENVNGIFNDAPVSGLPYICSPSNIQLRTTTSGVYSCEAGDSVTFQLGEITLGPIAVKADQVITPYTFYPNNNDAAINIAQLLQSMDNDGSYEDVISIDATKLAEIDQELDFTDPNFDANAAAMFAGTAVTLVSEEVAEQHLIENTDTIAPVVTLNGNATVHIDQGDAYDDEGATAQDNILGSMTPVKSGSVDTNVPGTYTIVWSASDTAGNEGTAQRTVIVDAVDSVNPVVTLNGDETVRIELNTEYIEQGASAVDDQDGEINVVRSGNVDTSSAGSYVITYSATDSSGNEGTATRTVIVNPLVDTVAPVVTLNGNTTVDVEFDTSYTDAGATATDNVDGTVTPLMSGSVDTGVSGIYTVTFTATDTAGNSGTATRTVTVLEAACENVNPINGECEDDTDSVCENVNPITGECEDVTEPVCENVNPITGECEDVTEPVCENVNPITGECEDVTEPAQCQNVNPITGQCED